VSTGAGPSASPPYPIASRERRSLGDVLERPHSLPIGALAETSRPINAATGRGGIEINAVIEAALTARFWAWVDEQRLASSQEQDGDGRWTRYVAGSPDRIDGMRRCDGVGLDELDEKKRQQLAWGRGEDYIPSSSWHCCDIPLRQG